ncbi:hypothetical protein [Xanthobacter autotrophicus]|uniref:hypothetical protein n=1 Tax=Xanthobacter autotrophicus TaxID=280 RepID=UPI0037279501
MAQTEKPERNPLQSGRTIRFLGVHGIKGEQAPGQAKGGDQILGGGDFVALIVDRQVAEGMSRSMLKKGWRRCSP